MDWIKKHKIISGVIGFFVIIVVLGAIGGSSTSTRSESTKTNTSIETAQSNPSPEEKAKEEPVANDSPAFNLAKLETNNPNPPENTIKSFDNILKSLSNKCSDKDERKIGDYIVFTQKTLKERQVSMDLLEVARRIDESYPLEAKDSLSCAEVATAFLTLMTK